MKKISIIFFLGFFTTQAFALKYMCQKAVRGNSGRYNSVKNSFESAQKRGELNQKKQSFLSTLDKAVDEITKAGCPMDDPDVTKIVNPIKELRAMISSAKANTPPNTSASTNTSVQPAVTNNSPTKTAVNKVANQPSTNSPPKKLSYPCRQSLRRQAGKPKDFERTLGPLREAVKSGKTIGNIQPGFLIDTKIDAALSDLQSSQCPTDHPDFKVVIDQLKAQQEEVPKIYKELKSRLDDLQKRADVSNYPDYQKDVEIFDVIAKRYSHADMNYDKNIDFNWKEGDPKKGVSFRLNIKTPIYRFEQLKNLLSNMVEDGNAYNSQMKLVEEKYKDLFKANPILAGKYVRMRDNAAKILGDFYKVNLEYLKKGLATTIEHNTKVIELWTKESMDKRRAEFFRGDTLKNILKSTNQAIELIAYTSKENKAKAESYKSKMNTINQKLKEATASLSEVMLKEQRLGKEKYEGSDKEKIRAKITEKFKEKFPGKELLTVRLINENWKVTDYVSWSSGNAYRTHYSELGFYTVMKETDKVAILVGGWYNVNHKQRNKVSVYFTFHGPDDVYQNRKILIENL
tara:strand:+ start:704 stop:2422 length:1719 start_codon:yes stop_codon:yes gene_type:complete